MTYTFNFSFLPIKKINTINSKNNFNSLKNKINFIKSYILNNIKKVNITLIASKQ